MSRTREIEREAFKEKIMELMSDGRPRTASDIELALKVKAGGVSARIRWLVNEGKINSEIVKGYIVYTCAGGRK